MCFSNILVKWISEFLRTNPQELKCWSSFCVNYFLRYYLMMQHQPFVKRVNGAHEWAHRPYQLLSAPSHSCLYITQTQAARWKAATPEQLIGAHLYLDIAKSGYFFHGYSGGMGPRLVITIPADVITTNGARPSGGLVFQTTMWLSCGDCKYSENHIW